MNGHPGERYNSDLLLIFFTERKYRIYRHLALISLLISSTWRAPFEWNTLTDSILGIGVLVLCYFNIYFLVPRYLLKDKFFQYCLIIAAIVGLEVLAIKTARQFLPARWDYPYRQLVEGINIFKAIFILIVLLASSATIKLFQRWVLDTRRINQLEAMTARAELEQLKNQITPHFLFNTLNNANVLTKRDPQKASEVLMNLSALLRYQLYDSARATVLLTADIRFLEDFLKLEKIRRDNFDIQIRQAGDMAGIMVAPLLFIIFVENAVKHNSNEDAGAYVHLDFELVSEVLHFRCVNPKNPAPVRLRTAGGLGLLNARRRLQLLYPNRHELTTEDLETSFTVHLTINL